jgi:hypothetical protein
MVSLREEIPGGCLTVHPGGLYGIALPTTGLVQEKKKRDSSKGI